MTFPSERQAGEACGGRLAAWAWPHIGRCGAEGPLLRVGMAGVELNLRVHINNKLIPSMFPDMLCTDV